jgi:decaprenyl-phosphate phosphoribosyltransferase
VTVLRPTRGEATVTRGGTVAALAAAVRPRQWLKNVLVVGAPIAAGRAHEGSVARDTLVAFAALCLAASSTYLVNDVHDAAEDRRHPRKRSRPVASGALSVPVALGAALALALAALALAMVASQGLVLLVAAYMVLTVAYTVRLRREPVVELVVVAAGFVLRGAGGGVAAGIPVSSWFLLVAGFGSLFLVAGKRYAELVSGPVRAGARATLEVYTPGFLRFVWTSAATLTIVAYALWATQVYLVRDDGSWGLWSIVPFVLALFRYALDIDGGRAEAPEDVLLGDRTLLVLGVAWVIMIAIGAGGYDLGF